MNNDNDILQKIILILTDNQKKDANGWLDLAALGQELSTAERTVTGKIRPFLESYPDYFELRLDDKYKPPIVYTRLKQSITNNSPRTNSNQTQSNISKISPDETKLRNWAYIVDFHNAIEDLKKLALPERWHYNKEDSNYPNPILVNYLNYTFTRLSHEKKISIAEDIAAFNTGLVNELYEPIYAIFDKNNREFPKWAWKGFCVAGKEYWGKILLDEFNPLPERANYFSNPADLIYNCNSTLYVDWNHIIENVDRFPTIFIEENCPNNFPLQDTSHMSETEKRSYFEQLADAIKNDSKTFRKIKHRLEYSLKVAQRRVEWNFKTAIPTYHIARKKLSLLIPLALIDDEVIDIALLIEKMKSGNYLGNTILPLDWAYNHARLITRLDSNWLVPEKITATTSVSINNRSLQENIEIDQEREDMPLQENIETNRELEDMSLRENIEIDQEQEGVSNTIEGNYPDEV